MIENKTIEFPLYYLDLSNPLIAGFPVLVTIYLLLFVIPKVGPRP